MGPLVVNLPRLGRSVKALDQLVRSVAKDLEELDEVAVAIVERAADLERAAGDPSVELPVELVRRLNLDPERGVRVNADDDARAVGAGAGLDALRDEVDSELFSCVSYCRGQVALRPYPAVVSRTS